MKATFRALFATAALTAATAVASDGRRPVYAPAMLPFVISQPGSYYLTEDLVVTGGSAISITASDVTLDLNGHTVRSTAASGALIAATDVSNIRITGGQLSGGGYGVQLARTAAMTSPVRFQVDHVHARGSITGVDVRGPSTSYPVAIVLEGNVVADTTNHGIYVAYGINGRVVGNEVNNASGSGIYLFNARNLIVSGNQSGNNTAAGLTLNVGTGNSLSRNGAYKNGTYGVYVNGTGNDLSENTAMANTSSGIYVTGLGNHVHENSATQNSIGLELYNFDEGSAQHNSLDNNTTYGIRLYLTDYSSIDWNVAAGNNASSGCQIQVESSDNNVLSYNRTPRVSTGCTSGANGIFQDAFSTGNTVTLNLP